MSKSLVLFIVVLGMCTAAAQAVTKRVLFIGNSYTYTNNMPLILQQLAASAGDTLIYDESDPGGYTLEQHTTNATTITKIFAQQWDLVVIHEQSQRPAFDPMQVAAEVYPFATRLDSMVQANDSCTQTMFMMTWGKPTGDHANCAVYPPICTYQGMQQRLRESYMQMAVDNNAIVAPVGMAFKVMLDSAYTPWLYSPDSSHPSVAGSYIEACVLYSSIFHKPILNNSYLSGLSATDAHLLQRVADKVVFDSMTLWQQHGHYPYAGFTYTQAGSTASFTSTPTIPAAGSWAMGDMTTDTAANPVHVYTGTGSFVVSRTVSNICFTETLTHTINIGVTDVGDMSGNGTSRIVAQGNGLLKYELQLHVNDKLELIDVSGRVVRRYTAQTLPVTDFLMQGLYVYRLFTSNGKEMECGKVAVY